MIAARRAEKARLETHMRVALCVIAAELAIMLGVLSFMTARVYSTSRAIHRVDQKLAKLKPTVEKIRSYQTEIKKLEPRLDLLADSREQTLFWYTVLQDLSRSVPANTWLCSMTTVRPVVSGPNAANQQPGSPTVTLRGTSVSQRLVGETMLRLNQYPEFRQVNLSFTQKGGTEDFQTVEFEIAALTHESEKGGTTSDAQN
jgi:Tfp pilus assembly protein PilN